MGAGQRYAAAIEDGNWVQTIRHRNSDHTSETILEEGPALAAFLSEVPRMGNTSFQLPLAENNSYHIVRHEGSRFPLRPGQRYAAGRNLQPSREHKLAMNYYPK